jgi:23S rRNA (adenine2503-C2)-methyltransferase
MHIVERLASTDGSVKYLWGLDSGHTVESICFRLEGKPITCISSQVGCNVACLFCETGKQPSLANLTPPEIVEQVRRALADGGCGTDGRFDSVIFAGMGEPLHNFDAVAAATRQLLDEGLTQYVTVTTSGIVPRMLELPSLPLHKLSVSLHATTDEVRNRLVPINKRYPIAAVLDAATRYRLATGNEVIVNYLLFDGVNDTDEDADRLAALLDPALFTVKFKEWNDVEGTGLRRSPPERLEVFQDRLVTRGFPVTLCTSRGQDVGGGCGQLRSKHAPIATIWQRRIAEAAQ